MKMRICNRLSCSGRSFIDKVLSGIIVVAILGAIGTLSYAIAKPMLLERFTEFYVLGLEGKAADYHTALKVGEEGKVILGIVNHERETVSYRVEVRIDGEKKTMIESLVLNNEQKWEDIVEFTVDKAGDKQKVEFLLYKQPETEIYLSLHLWIDVE